jgi:hypothetical protein
MDSHCHVIGCCIALRNHQPFIVMLHWGTLGVLVHLTVGLCRLACHGLTMMLSASVFGLAFLFGILGWTLRSQVNRLKRNVTTIESLRLTNAEVTRGGTQFDLGDEENFSQIMGTCCLRRWIPQIPVITGFEWAYPEFCNGRAQKETEARSPFLPTIQNDVLWEGDGLL